MTPQYMTIRGLAELISASERTVHEMRSKGLLPAPYWFGPRAMRFERGEVMAALAALPRGKQAEPAHLAAARHVEAVTAED